MVVSAHFLRHSSGVPDDQLSTVLDVVGVRGLMTGGVVAQGHWVSRGPLEDPVKFFAMVSGRAWLSTDGVSGEVGLEAGDVAVLSGRAWIALRGGAGEGPPREVLPTADFSSEHFAGADPATHDILVGGCIDLDPAGRELLARALPPLTHLSGSAASGTPLRSTLHRLFGEVGSGRPGSEFAIRQHSQLLVLEVLRAHLDEADLPPGWLRLLSDDRLRPAVALMHAEPGRPWGLPELARAASMSRTSFATRFRAVAGVPPLTYLNRWRMLLAQRALRGAEARVGALASELGYASESAFSTAFKREVGESPLRYRQRVGRGAGPVM